MVLHLEFLSLVMVYGSDTGRRGYVAIWGVVHHIGLYPVSFHSQSHFIRVVSLSLFFFALSLSHAEGIDLVVGEFFRGFRSG